MIDPDAGADGRTDPAWPIAGAIGFGLCAGIFLLMYLVGWLNIHSGVQLLGLVIVCIVLGFLPGAILSLMAGLVRRMRAARPVPYFNDGWTQLCGRCETAYDQFLRVLGAAEIDPIRDRLRALADRLTVELDEARSLTAFGRDLDAYVGVDGPTDPDVREVWEKASTATDAFEQTAAGAERLRRQVAGGHIGLAAHAALDELSAGLPNVRRD